MSAFQTKSIMILALLVYQSEIALLKEVGGCWIYHC